jgi:hypothetical protein
MPMARVREKVVCEISQENTHCSLPRRFSRRFLDGSFSSGVDAKEASAKITMIKKGHVRNADGKAQRRLIPDEKDVEVALEVLDCGLQLVLTLRADDEHPVAPPVVVSGRPLRRTSCSGGTTA